MKLVSPQESNKPYNLYACTKTGNIIEVDITSFSVCNSVSVNGIYLTLKIAILKILIYFKILAPN